MNKVVFEHYPAAKLPAELREGIDSSATVKVIVEQESGSPMLEDERWPGFAKFPKFNREPMTIGDTIAAIRRVKAENRPSVTVEEAVARIRQLRDEWDD
jgi:hypothetical protein